jgi:hypothetical protein
MEHRLRPLARQPQIGEPVARDVEQLLPGAPARVLAAAQVEEFDAGSSRSTSVPSAPTTVTGTPRWASPLAKATSYSAWKPWESSTTGGVAADAGPSAAR